MEDSSGTRLPPRLVLYDGVCAFCDRCVQSLLDIDRTGQLHFAPLQGSTAAALRREHPEIPTDVDTIVYVETSGNEQHIYQRSEAIVRIGTAVGLRSRILRWMERVPRPLADLAYRVFARVRYRVFGTLKACRVPSPEVCARFLP